VLNPKIVIDTNTCGSGLARDSNRSVNAEFKLSKEQGISGRFDGLFLCLENTVSHISISHNQMNKYDLKIYKSPVKVSPSKRDRTRRIANTVQGII
jgi:hypothetical protein